MADYKFYGYFTASKVGKPLLTVLVDVYGPGGVEASDQVATEIGGGLYSYIHTDATPGDYMAIFKTADITVDYQHVPDLVTKELPLIDAAVSSRSSHTAADVWAVGSRTLTSFGTLVADIWSHATRTLTQSAAQVAAILAGSTITVQRGDTLTVSLTDLGDISSRTKLWFAVKESSEGEDTEATIFLEETAGLTVVNGETYATITDGEISVTDEVAGDLTVTILPSVTKDLAGGTFKYELQTLSAAGAVLTLTRSSFKVSPDIVRAVS